VQVRATRSCSVEPAKKCFSASAKPTPRFYTKSNQLTSTWQRVLAVFARLGLISSSSRGYAGGLDDVSTARVLDGDINELILQISRAKNPDIESSRAWATTVATDARCATHPGFAPGVRSRFSGS
jgi:hypothetical protein